MATTFWNKTERKLLGKLNTPAKIQAFLDKVRYNISEKTHSPRFVMKLKTAHCFDGALFAAAALEFNGDPPILVDLRSNHEDDDHVLAIFKRCGRYGAVAKSNYTGCRYRDPVFQTVRELVMSYFPIYFNLAGKKTLREFSVPFPLSKIKDVDWRKSPEDLTFLGDRIDRIRHFRLINKASERFLAMADERTFRGETLGLDPRGAFKAKGARIRI